MYKSKKILAIIPARGGSKGIPRKNLKVLHTKPLIGHILNTLSNTEFIDKIMVSTDDDSIIEFCKNFKSVECLKRPKELAEDNITLDPVIYHAYESASKYSNYDYIFTFQPTSPLLKKETIKRGIKKIIDNEYDSLLTVVDDKHLCWSIKDNKYFPSYQKRVNRQELPPNFRETGSILACSNKIISKDTRIGKNIYLLEISPEEAIDIDNYNDWILAEEIMKSPKIAFIVTGNKKNGLGHVYRCLTIANRLNSKPIFVVNESDHLAIKKITESFYPIHCFKDSKEINRITEKHEIDIVINDTLNTTTEYINELKKGNKFIVTFEDFGDGSEYAHLSFNALYENTNPQKNHYYGYKYFCLRDEFIYSEKKRITPNVKNVLITFGGTDPNNITQFVTNCLKNYSDLNIEIIVGIGYSKIETLKKEFESFKNIKIHSSVNNMSKHILKADIVITSNGRTTYEIASIGVPAIAICQNEREIKHTFGEVTKTIINLGLFDNITSNKFIEYFNNLYEDYEKRKKINQKMLNLNLNRGIERVIKTIIETYDKNTRGASNDF